MSKPTRIAGMLAVVVLLGGCGGGDAVFDDGAGGFGVGGGGNDGGVSQGNPLGGPGSIDGRDDGSFGSGPTDPNLMSNIVVYFEFDQSDIRAEFNDMLAAHGSFLTGNPGARVRLEGHADETGSREYNIGLGERRAQAVRRILMLQGASATQLSTVSYGEERPAALGSDEEAYGLNRRVELVYE